MCPLTQGDISHNLSPHIGHLTQGITFHGRGEITSHDVSLHKGEVSQREPPHAMCPLTQEDIPSNGGSITSHGGKGRSPHSTCPLTQGDITFHGGEYHLTLHFSTQEDFSHGGRQHHISQEENHITRCVASQEEHLI